MNFNDTVLVKKYGSWVRVQVAFYDFLFKTASQMCAKCFRETAEESIRRGEFADGEDFYEAMMDKLEEMFESTEEAWTAFVAQENDEEEQDEGDE